MFEKVVSFVSLLIAKVIVFFTPRKKVEQLNVWARNKTEKLNKYIEN